MAARHPRSIASAIVDQADAVAIAPPRRSPRCQRDDGHWVFELEADATIPAEYVLLHHYLGEPDDPELEAQDRPLSSPHPGRA